MQSYRVTEERKLPLGVFEIETRNEIGFGKTAKYCIYLWQRICIFPCSPFYCRGKAAPFPASAPKQWAKTKDYQTPQLHQASAIGRLFRRATSLQLAKRKSVSVLQAWLQQRRWNAKEV